MRQAAWEAFGTAQCRARRGHVGWGVGYRAGSAHATRLAAAHGGGRNGHTPQTLHSRSRLEQPAHRLCGSRPARPAILRDRKVLAVRRDLAGRRVRAPHGDGRRILTHVRSGVNRALSAARTLLLPDTPEPPPARRLPRSARTMRRPTLWIEACVKGADTASPWGGVAMDSTEERAAVVLRANKWL